MFWHWLMPPTGRGAVGEIPPDWTEGGCEGVTGGVSDGGADGDCDDVTAGVSEGVTLGGVGPDCGCAKAVLASTSNAALAIDLRVMAFSLLGRPSLT
jgi:hypothetical protein